MFSSLSSVLPLLARHVDMSVVFSTSEMSFNWGSKVIRVDKSKFATDASFTDRWSDHLTSFFIFFS